MMRVEGRGSRVEGRGSRVKGLSLLILLGLALVACGPRPAAQNKVQETKEVAPRVTKVRTTTAQSGTLSFNRTAGVTLSPVRESQVAATASGKVLQVLVEEGSRVVAGQAVVRLDPVNAQTSVKNAELALQQAKVNLDKASRSSEGSIAPLKAALDSALANLQVAERRYTEGKQLFQAGAIAQVELTGLEAAYNQAQAGADNARESLDRAQRAGSEDLALLRLQIQQAESQLAQARRGLGDTQVKAPFAGVVAEVYVNPGEFVGAGSRAFRLADTSRLEAKFRIPPSEAAKLPIGTSMNLDYAGRTYFAKLTRTSQIPGTDRLVEAIATVSAPLTPGASANLRYNLTLAQGVLVPSGAVLAGEKSQVFVVQGDKAKAVEVQTLGDNGSRAALSGIPAGAQVVFPVPASLRSGDTIEVIR